MERQYDYRPKWTVIVCCAFFFGACAFVLGTKASTNERGLIIRGLVELSPAGATIFYWALGGLSACFVFAAALLAVMRLTRHQRIVLTDTSVIVPRSRWSSEEVTVPFADIVELSRSEVSGQHLLKIVCQGGTFTVTASMLPRKEDFEEICQAVLRGMQANEGRPR